jgi:dihydroorotate dehydrogenase
MLRSRLLRQHISFGRPAMPDWTYQTLFRPLLFRLPAPRARALTLGALGALGRHRLGPQLIALMGHMRPPPSIARQALGLRFASPVGIGADLPGNEGALAALARFGVGFVEVGPVALRGEPPAAAARRDATGGAIAVGASAASAGSMSALLARAGRPPALVSIRLAHAPGASAAEAARERAALIARLAPQADFFTLAPPPHAWGAAAWRDHLAHTIAAARAHGQPLLIGLAADALLAERAAVAQQLGADGLLVLGDGGGAEGARLLGQAVYPQAVDAVRALRKQCGPEVPLVAAGGAQEPAQAIALLDAGATLVQLDAGLVFGGPGLPKRTNEALHWRQERAAHEPLPRTAADLLGAGWFWMLLLGLGMLVAGALAWLVAATRVVLPYDEAFVGASRAQLAAINGRLLSFMAHDRVSLASTMIAIGVLYAQLAVHGLRQRAHWAYVTIAVSAAVGFASFFLFLGYGYFDPLHALLALLLLPLFLLGLRRPADAPPAVPRPDLHNDRAWWLAQWGQLGAVALGVGLVGAGGAIMGVGVTAVFVPEDLAFLCTTRDALQAANDRLVALIAHDRAGFGGALVSNGLAVLLLSLWGVRRGARWVWWTLLAAGAPGFAGALGVHWAVGYLDWWHLLPGVLALAVYVATLLLLFPYLCGGAGHEQTAPRKRSDMRRAA